MFSLGTPFGPGTFFPRLSRSPPLAVFTSSSCDTFVTFPLLNHWTSHVQIGASTSRALQYEFDVAVGLLSNLRDVLAQLKSEKVKERTDGVIAIRQVFSRNTAVDGLDSTGNAKTWLLIFQALFTTVASEKAATLKKTDAKGRATKTAAGSSTAAARRLQETASAVRWLVARAVHRINRKVVVAVLAHTRQTMVSKGELSPQVALHYIKTIKCIFQWTPHLDRLDVNTWISLVELAFNVVLGDPIRQPIEDDDAPKEEPDALDDGEEDELHSEGGSPSKKRARSASPTKKQHKPGLKPTAVTVSLEQIEFTSLLGLLLSWPSAPLLSESHPKLANAVLTRLARFVEMYPADTSMYHDYLIALSATLSHLALNRTRDVQQFARKAWDGLVGLWGTKNKQMKEGLVAVLGTLFPYLTSETQQKHSWTDGIRKLNHLLDGEAESRWGVEGLSLDSLRLEMDSTPGAFVAKTFRAGWSFDAGQALAWAILDLQADCIAKLYQHSESAPISRHEGKRTRIEDPLTCLLSSIRQNHLPSHVRAYHLQTLLFFIDRHWDVPHETLHQAVLATLVQNITSDDSVIQSWVFTCLAAIASTHTSITSWESVWTQTVRRSSVVTVCRAASHAASAILQNAKHLLIAPSKILNEIETFVKDLDVQGPVFPYDSVCIFLAHCLRVASQDVRLYRMQLEDKVLGWLVDNWTISELPGGGGTRGGGARAKIPMHMVKDVLLLCERICSFQRRSDVVCKVLLPECATMETMLEQSRTQVIRDFILEAKLPPFLETERKHRRTVAPGGGGNLPSTFTINNADLSAPQPRERKLSTFLLKSLETLVAQWEVLQTIPSADSARHALDLTVVALSFESLLMLNGTRSTRRTVQTACRLVELVAPFLDRAKWSLEEKALVLLGLDPLTCIAEQGEEEGWVALLPPCETTGIRMATLNRLLAETRQTDEKVRAGRLYFQKLMWRSSDVQDKFAHVMDSVRNVLSVVTGQKTEGGSTDDAQVEMDDGFGPIRTTANGDAQPSETNEASEDTRTMRCIMDVCVSFLTMVPVLQSASGEPTRDKSLTELVLATSDANFLVVAAPFFNQVRQKTLEFPPTKLEDFLERFEPILQGYLFGRSVAAQYLVTNFLASTMHMWLGSTVRSSDAGVRVQQLCHWLGDSLAKHHIGSWSTRDYVAQFLGSYLATDPTQSFWLSDEAGEEEEGEEQHSPLELLPLLGGDEDIHVRFRASALNAQSLRGDGKECMMRYSGIHSKLTRNIESYEHMLTRMLTLGNAMVVASSVRRGPYWHLLEPCLYADIHGPDYTRHIAAVLAGVAVRMGLDNFSELFEAYNTQFAITILANGLDILNAPTHLLGYKDRRQCAEANFQAFTPDQLLAQVPNVAHGKALFAKFCKVLQKAPADGVRECFGDIVGRHVALSMWDENLNTAEMEAFLREALHPLDENGFNERMENNMDGVMVAALRTLGDSSAEELVQALSMVSKEAAQTFKALTAGRDIQIHTPNLPSASATAVIRALQWLGQQVRPESLSANVYHVLHGLFANVQRSPLVNEQIRLMNAICVWISIHANSFDDSTLLRALTHAAALTLSQSDLAQCALSILQWALARHRKTSNADPRLAGVLVRICSRSLEYVADPLTVELGHQLLGWVNKQTSILGGVEALRDQVIKAALAWPDALSEPLQELVQTATLESVAEVLGDRHIVSNRFGLVRRIREDPENLRWFSSRDFWRLKACIPPRDQLNFKDAQAFAAVLVQHKGHLESFGNETKTEHTIRDYHIRSARRGEEHSSAHETAIVLALLGMLDSSSSRQVHVAYMTLRLLMSVASSRTQQRSWPALYGSELEYLTVYTPLLPSRPARQLDKLAGLHEVAANFTVWITTFTLLLADVLGTANSFYAQLEGVIKSDAGFAERLMPVLVHAVLEGQPTPIEAIGESSPRSLISAHFSLLLREPFAPCLRPIVETVLHLRHFIPKGTKDPLAGNHWLDVDFTLLAAGAATCGAYTTSLLFLELASEGKAPDKPEKESIMYDIYQHIDEPDGFYAIKTKDHRQFLMRRFHHENQWEQALRFHGASLESNASGINAADGVMQSFHAFGFNYLAMDTLQRSSLAEGAVNSSAMSLGWRTETWDLPVHANSEISGASLYLALRAVHRERDPAVIQEVIRDSFASELVRLRNLGPENMTEIHEVVRNLMSLHQVSEFRTDSVLRRLEAKDLTLADWPGFTAIDDNIEFPDMENMLATRISLVRSVGRREQQQQLGDMVSPFPQSLIQLEKACLLRLARGARDTNHLQIALNSVIRAQELERTPTFAVSHEFANVLWMQKEPKMAVEFLSELLTHPDFDAAPIIMRSSLLTLLGSWMAEACLQSPTTIMDEFFARAIALLPEPAQEHAQTYYRFASFAAHQHEMILKSPDNIRRKVNVERKEQELVKLKIADRNAGGRLVHDIRKAQRMLEEDRTSLDFHNQAQSAFLAKAIEMYALAMQCSDAYDGDAAVRLCSLWFANFSNVELQTTVKAALERVASRKFVFFAHQLSARLTSSIPEDQPGLTASQQSLQSLLVRMCTEHPFHSLYQVYSLKPPGKPQAPRGRRQSTRHEPQSDISPSQSDRAEAAGGIFSRLKTSPSVRDAQKLCAASLEWAMYPIKDDRRYLAGSKYNVPEEIELLKLSNLKVPVMTADTPLDITMRYDQCVWVKGYEPKFTTAGGINLPKISACVGSDGNRYKQLFKGEGPDDLRQDAVMEQVFEIVNGILDRDKDTKRRALRVRVYKIITLSSQAGVLEFVSNTRPLLDWIDGAQKRYSPHSLFHKNASGLLIKKRKAVLDSGVKRELVTQACRDDLIKIFKANAHKVEPILRHFFTENGKNPTSWFASRLNYIRSVATTSIVGHILGLGDRHCSNILIDNSNGEVIHIDLGIAFEQGRILVVPELVPFRMTPNIIDGMGSSGTTGVFQRCAEETLRVLRDGSEVILTVLEVFKHDPLHSWAANEIKVNRMQGHRQLAPKQSTSTAIDPGRPIGPGFDITTGTAEEAADRALGAVARKLDKAMSVEYTVNTLLADATNPEYLAVIFPGWGPFT